MKLRKHYFVVMALLAVTMAAYAVVSPLFQVDPNRKKRVHTPKRVPTPLKVTQTPTTAHLNATA